MNDGTDLQLYTLLQNYKPIAYRYGEEWVATQLLMEGGYSTPITAWLAWLFE